MTPHGCITKSPITPGIRGGWPVRMPHTLCTEMAMSSRPGGRVPGYWIFPHGLFMSHQRTGDARSKEATLALAQQASYAAVSTYPRGWVQDAVRSREVAYNLMTKLLADEPVGGYQRDVDQLVDLALGHLHQWFVARTTHIQPSMAALTAEALIHYHKKTNDARVRPAVRTAMDYLWDHLWIASEKAFFTSTARFPKRAARDACGPHRTSIS